MRAASAPVRFGLAFLGGCLMAIALFFLMLRMVTPPKPDVSDEPIAIASFVKAADGEESEKSAQQSPRQAPEPPSQQPPQPNPKPSPTPMTAQASLPKLDLELPTIDAGVSVAAAPTPSLDGLKPGQPGGAPPSGSSGAAGAPASGAAGAAGAAGGEAGGASGGPELDVMPLNDIRPNYPRRALQRGIEGYIKLLFTINSRGGVENIRVVESSPPGVFDREARRAAARWRFSPRTQNGVSVAREASKTLHFRLER